tara:strand:+ start:22774 stop:23235 length:462 start_codon:yes stop_codon:yes gene_type:complete
MKTIDKLNEEALLHLIGDMITKSNLRKKWVSMTTRSVSSFYRIYNRLRQKELLVEETKQVVENGVHVDSIWVTKGAGKKADQTSYLCSQNCQVEIQSLKALLIANRQELVACKHTLSNYISYLQNEIQSARPTVLHRLNREQNTNNMERKTNE